MVIANGIALFIAWRLVLYLSFHVYGIKTKEIPLLIQCAPLAFATDILADVCSFKIYEPMIICVLTFLLVWYTRKNLVEASVISSTSCEIGFIVHDITYLYWDPEDKLGETLFILAIIVLIILLVSKYKLQFSFLRSPKIISLHRKDILLVYISALALLALSGFFSTLLPKELSIYLVTVGILCNFFIVITKSFRLEIIL